MLPCLRSLRIQSGICRLNRLGLIPGHQIIGPMFLPLRNQGAALFVRAVLLGSTSRKKQP